MNTLGIKTTLQLHSGCTCACNNFAVVRRGETAEFIFDLNNYAYIDQTPMTLELATEEPQLNQSVQELFPILNSIDQIIYLFKGVGYTKEFVMITSGGSAIDNHFQVNNDGGYISFILSSEETKEMPLAFEDDPIKCEVVVKLRNTRQDSVMNYMLENGLADAPVTGITTLIEPQNPIIVIDSLYAQSGLSA